MIFPGFSDSKALETLGLIHGVSDRSKSQAGATGIVLAHGRSGDAKSMWLFAKAFPQKALLVVSPQAPFSHSRGGYSWWPEEDTGKEAKGGEVNNDGLFALSLFVRKLPDVYPIDPQKIWGVGFSQGAAVLCSLSLLYPGIFQGVAMLSGFIPRTVLKNYGDDFRGEEFRRSVSTTKYFIAHGTKDAIVPYSRAEEAKSELQSFGAQVELVKEAVGHKVGSRTVRELSEWFSA